MSRNRRKFERKKITYEEAVSLKANQYAASDEQEGIAFELYDLAEDHRITIAELVEKFYRIILPEKGVKGSSIVKPAVFTLMEDPHSVSVEKYWMAVFRANFWVNIYPRQGVHGPHTAQLWFKSFTTKEFHWIATLQIVEFFFDEDKMKAALLKAIIEKEWFYPSYDAARSIVP